jgi:DNA-binding beta-propeller fold protein YncE
MVAGRATGEVNSSCFYGIEDEAMNKLIAVTVQTVAIILLQLVPIQPAEGGTDAIDSLKSTSGTPAKDVVKWPGLQPDGSVLLHNQWSVRPAGRQIELGNCFPVDVAIKPGGRYAAVLHAGYTQHEVVTVDLNTGTVVGRMPLHETFYGLAFSHDGTALYCSGGGDEVVHRFSLVNGQLANHTEINIHDRTLRAVPCGLAVNRAESRLFVANVLGDSVSEVKLGAKPVIVDISVGTKPAHLAVAPVIPPEDFDTAAADKRDEVGFYNKDPDHSYPYACCLDEKRQRLYVSLWAQAGVSVVDLQTGGVSARWPAEDHPCEMALTHSGKLLYVANANRNTVTIFDTSNGNALETIWAAFFPDAPSGSTPNSLALSPDEKTLFVATANVNAIAVFDVSLRGKSASLGFIPTGWYPTSVRVTPDGRRLLVANGKGATTKSDLPINNKRQYIATLYRGSLSVIDLPDQKHWEQQMASWTAEVHSCTPLKAHAAVSGTRPEGNPIPAKAGDPSPIKYVIYIVKENRTYDQVFGDIPQGNGDAKICLFPDRVTPNQHKIARQFVLLDNFYADAEVSASGHEWSMGAYCTDFVEKAWPMNYGHNRSGKFPYPAEGYFPIAAPSDGYLWDRAREAGVSYISYGEFVDSVHAGRLPVRARVKGLQGHVDPMYPGFDLLCSDLTRADRFISEFKRLEAADQMPRLQIVRLPNDHTHGTTPFFPSPSACVAQNDLALGHVIEVVSHSKYWPQMAIFIVEDDAQSGTDHVDAHRTVAMVASPYARGGVKDSTMYSTTSMLRTMELILGLKPMSQFDAAATPMFNSFQAEPDLRPYDSAPATYSLEEKNPLTAWGSKLKMNFSREDAVDDHLLNEVIWKSVRGASSPMPPPVRAAFILGRKDDDD